ncbi:hypothetical protein AHAS_Ahas20G0262200 [Arachis hypogaea]
MADDHDNDHNSGLVDRTPNKDADATSKDTPQNGGDKQPPNTEILEAIRKQQNRLKQLEQEVERNLRRETRRRRELEDKLLKLEADLKAKTTQSGHEDSPHKDQDPFTKEIMKAKVPKNFKAPNMTPYDGISDSSHHLSNFRSRMYLTETSDAIRYSPSKKIRLRTPQSIRESSKEIGKVFATTWKDSTKRAWTYKVCQQKQISWVSSMAYKEDLLAPQYPRSTQHL